MEIKTAKEIREAMKNKFENNSQLAFEFICSHIMKKIEKTALNDASFFTTYNFEIQDYVNRACINIEDLSPIKGEEEKVFNYLKYIINSYKDNSDKELYNAFESQVVTLLIEKGYTVEKEEGLLNRFKITIRWDKEDTEENK